MTLPLFSALGQEPGPDRKSKKAFAAYGLLQEIEKMKRTFEFFQKKLESRLPRKNFKALNAKIDEYARKTHKNIVNYQDSILSKYRGLLKLEKPNLKGCWLGLKNELTKLIELTGLNDNSLQVKIYLKFNDLIVCLNNTKYVLRFIINKEEKG